MKMIFQPGITPVPVHGAVLDDEDWNNLHAAVDQHWLTAGNYTANFEKALEKKLECHHAIFTNSGSSALLLAMAALELPEGSEVITCACSFPTTVNVIAQCKHIPVFVDCEQETWNMDPTKLNAALSEKTRALIVTHTMGNPANMEAITDFCIRNQLFMIEDCCDAMLATYKGTQVGTFGAFAAYSFQPAHMITTGEGGLLTTNNPRLAKIALSLRNWGRDCWCVPGQDNACGRRYEGEYDHKYTYSHIGWHLAATDLQAAIGLSQLKKLDHFIQCRNSNWFYLFDGLEDLPIRIQALTCHGRPSWFGFAFGTEKRNELARYLDQKLIGNRPLFAGNIIRQPAYKYATYRISGDLLHCDYAMEHVIWLGVWPGLTLDMLDYTIATLREWYGKRG